MSGGYFYGAARRPGPSGTSRPSRPDASSGKPLTGRIVKLMVGQGHGFIRLPNDREVYFHRADVQDGTVFNDLRIGDVVKFELLEDAVSGARALGVRRPPQSR